MHAKSHFPCIIMSTLKLRMEPGDLDGDTLVGLCDGGHHYYGGSSYGWLGLEEFRKVRGASPVAFLRRWAVFQSNSFVKSGESLTNAEKAGGAYPFPQEALVRPDRLCAVSKKALPDPSPGNVAILGVLPVGVCKERNAQIVFAHAQRFGEAFDATHGSPEYLGKHGENGRPNVEPGFAGVAWDDTEKTLMGMMDVPDGWYSRDWGPCPGLDVERTDKA
jgi:hypothetical protein